MAEVRPGVVPADRAEHLGLVADLERADVPGADRRHPLGLVGEQSPVVGLEVETEDERAAGRADRAPGDVDPVGAEREAQAAEMLQVRGLEPAPVAAVPTETQRRPAVGRELAQQRDEQGIDVARVAAGVLAESRLLDAQADEPGRDRSADWGAGDGHEIGGLGDPGGNGAGGLEPEQRDGHRCGRGGDQHEKRGPRAASFGRHVHDCVGAGCGLSKPARAAGPDRRRIRTVTGDDRNGERCRGRRRRRGDQRPRSAQVVRRRPCSGRGFAQGQRRNRARAARTQRRRQDHVRAGADHAAQAR